MADAAYHERDHSSDTVRARCGEGLHRLLFPIGRRQQDALGAARAGPEGHAAFRALHQGIARALQTLVAESGTSPAVARWLLMSDAGPASELLWGQPVEEDAVRTAAAGYRRHLERTGDLGDSYCLTTAADLRHRLGEHYTPHWLVRKMADSVHRAGIAADPACGDGRFLVALLRAGRRPEDIWGTDLNPLAVVMARINVWRHLGAPTEIPPVCIEWGDFVLGLGGRNTLPAIQGAVNNVGRLPTAAVYIGNPPWVTWRNLSDHYRGAIADRMSSSRLNHKRGWAARVSAGQSDMSHIFVHEAVERVASTGQVAFVLPRSTFKAPVGPGPLREGISTGGRRYRFEEVWDCAEPDPFTGVRTDAVVAFVNVDQPHTFPVAWRLITARGTHGARHAALLSDPDDASSPWMTSDDGDGGPLCPIDRDRWTDLKARGGVNTGGGNSVFHVEVLRTRKGILTIRNVPSRRTPMESLTADVEPTYVRPLLRGRDVRQWRAVPSGHIVVPHDPEDLRKPVREQALMRDAPLTYRYLENFREFLASRKEVARWAAETWYTLFRIGPYTAGCWRVVWPHSSNGHLRAAVLPPDDRTIPDQKVVLVPFTGREPAFFLTALLNSSAVRDVASRSAGMDASPNLVRRLNLPRFNGDDRRHQQIVALASRLVDGRRGHQPDERNAAAVAADAAVCALFTRPARGATVRESRT